MSFPPLSLFEGGSDPEKLKARLSAEGFKKITVREIPPVLRHERPRAYLKRLMAHACEDDVFWVYLVLCGSRILGIPSDAKEAEAMLTLLSGRRHQVWVCFWLKSHGKTSSKTVITRVSFKRLTQAEIKGYGASDDWKGRAAGYSAFGKAAPFIKSINGSPSALSGVPEFEWASFLQSKKF